MPEKLKIEKLIGSGQGLARLNGQAVFVWNALPGETVEARIISKKKNFLEAEAEKIIIPSPHRVDPKEDHFASCSPWQTLEYEQEKQWKKTIDRETYVKIGGFDPGELDMVGDENRFGYRQKIEYHLCQDQTGAVAPAFFNRGGQQKNPVSLCVLAAPALNSTAKMLIDWLNTQNIPERSLKSIIIRGNGLGQTIAGIFLKDKLSFTSLPSLSEKILGWRIFFSTHRSPASVPTELLCGEGQDWLEENIEGVKLRFGLFSFFQINPPIFSLALNEIKKHLSPDSPIIDFYSGVGAIGLSTHNESRKTVLVEDNAEAADFAQKNITLNRFSNCEIFSSVAEKKTDLISADSTVIFDPPRAGLHRKIIGTLMAKKPRTIIYLSCDVATHARDIGLLKPYYQIRLLRLYNFFPATPHTESLAVLTKKE